MEHVSFSPATPTLLATANGDVRIWDLAAGKLLARLPHPARAIRVRFSADGTELMSSCENGTFCVWDWRRGKLEEGLLLHPAAELVMDFRRSADRRWLATLGTAGLQLTDWRTKTPAGPLWPLKRNINLALDIPAGDGRVIVGGFSGSLVGYDLKAMVTPATAPVEELVRFAELTAGRRILTGGNVVPLTSVEWADRWQHLRRKNSPLLPPRR